MRILFSVFTLMADTLAQVKGGVKFYRKSIKEEHIAVIQEPSSKYLGHVTPNSGSAQDECNALYDFATKELNGGLSELLVAGADGTNVNTGWKGGVIWKLDEKHEKPMQWVICLLHFNELPFCSLFQFVDGPSLGPSTFTGPIGSKLQSVKISLLLSIRQFNVTYRT